MTLLEMSMMGAVMILAVCAVRAAVLNRLPRRTFVLLWIVCAARLIFPWQISSPMSVYNLLRPQAAACMDTGRTFAATVVTVSPELAAQDAVAAEYVLSDSAAVSAWTAVWWLGLMICAGIAAFLYIRWQKRFAESLPVKACAVRTFLKEHPLKRPLAVRSTVYISAPLTYGVLRPVILLPRSMDLTDEKQLKYILMHEYMHVRHLDALLKLLFAAVVCVHWFNPAVWLMYALAARDMELACDESVVAGCGARADYARMLIQLESRKLMQFVPGVNGSAGAARERIKSIMKLKKRSVLAIVAAGALIAGVSTAFATGASEVRGGSAWSDTIVQETFASEEMTCAGSDGETEWWTAEEYEAWLETEKAELQSILGSKSWTPTEGEFEWTQEKIDETTERYEQILQDIRAGARISKSVDGDESTMIIHMGSAQESGAEQGDLIDAELFEEYAAFGLAVSSDGLLYEGEKVAYFEDNVEIEPDMYASKATFFSDDGTACIRTVRRPTQNPDGSTDPFGQLTGLERIPGDEAQALIRNLQTGEVIAVEDTMTPAGTTIYQGVELESIVAEDLTTAADLAPYQAVGLEYEALPNGLFLMRYKGRDVHSLYDPVTGTWFASNMHGSNLGPDRVDLEAVYQDGRFASLKVLPEQHGKAACADDSAAAEGDTTFEQKFAAYRPFGLTSRKVQTSLGGTGYNLFLNGEPVNHFADVAPDGSAFSYDSAEQVPGGLNVHVTYKGSAPVRINKE